MDYGIAQGEFHAADGRHPQLRGLGTTMATAASRSIGTKIGARLAIYAQEMIKNLRQPKS